MNTIALYLGYAALLALALIALCGAYLVLYELCRAIGKKLFLPIWLWHIITVIAVVRASGKQPGVDGYIRFLFETVDRQGRKYPELKGLLDEYCRRRMNVHTVMRGRLIRAGTFPIRDEEVTGLVVECTREEIEHIAHLPMLRPVVVTQEPQEA